MSPNPEYKLVQGLPGGGKTELLTWIRFLLEEVWFFVHGVHFVMTARLNSMADNLHGVTMHKYWRIRFQNSGGAFVNSTSNGDAWTDLLTRCASLKLLFIDEIETCDIQLLAQVEEKQVACSARHDMFASEGGDSQNAKRLWGGVNVVMTGDWWQLTPTGGVAVMSNPVKH